MDSFNKHAFLKIKFLKHKRLFSLRPDFFSYLHHHCLYFLLLHHSVGIVIDIETDSPAEVLPHVKQDYSSISEEATQHLNRILDPEAPLQESYPVPLIESGGKK